MADDNEHEGIYPIGKAVLGAVWLFGTASYFPPLQNASVGELGRNLFVVLAITHALECLAFIGTLRKSPRPLVGELWQTFLFGIVHISTLRRELGEDR